MPIKHPTDKDNAVALAKLLRDAADMVEKAEAVYPDKRVPWVVIECEDEGHIRLTCDIRFKTAKKVQS